MPTNPFEDDNKMYGVLRNAEGQFSIWPVGIDVPDGWDVVLWDENRKTCLTYIEETWTDMRPLSLVQQMNADRSGAGESM